MEAREILRAGLFMLIMSAYLTTTAQTENCSGVCSTACSSARHAENEVTLEELNTAIQNGTDPATAYDNRGLYYTKTSKYDAAIKDFNKALEYDTNRCDIYNHLGIVYYFLDDYKTALYYYDQALMINPGYAKAYFNRGIVKIKIEDEEGAFFDIKYASKLKHKAATDFLSENYNKNKPFGM